MRNLKLILSVIWRLTSRLLQMREGGSQSAVLRYPHFFARDVEKSVTTVSTNFFMDPIKVFLQEEKTEKFGNFFSSNSEMIFQTKLKVRIV